MEVGDSLRRYDRPSLLQIQYLIELERSGGKRGCISLIAETCNVTPGVVSRYIKSCIKNGYLTERYQFTELGQQWLDNYKKILSQLREYLRSVGIPEQEIYENVKNMIENIDLHTLRAMMEKHEEVQPRYTTKKKTLVAEELEEAVRKYGRIGIHFKLYRLGKGADNSFSMANRGFAPILHLVMKENQEYLELQIHEMMASSRVDGKPMQGHVNTLKYEDHGHIAVAEIEGDKLYIPLDACRMHCRPGSELVGIVPVMLTCTVGRTHMPESTALLIFWA